MPNNTFEDYKKAVKKKYEREKDSEHFVYLNNPTRAKLRNLCWELFVQQNRNQDDLNVFSSLLGLPFDVNRKNKFDEQIDKFRPIENFFKGETDPSNVDAVNMAAILVDFKARPFNKFRIQELFEDEDEIDNEKNSELSNAEIDQNNNAGILESFLDKKEREKVSGREEKISGIEVIKPKPINSFVDVDNKKNLQSKFPPVGKRSILSFIGLLCLIGLITYYVLPDKKCMQWSVDHYETVDCDLRIQGLGQSANIEIIDPTLIHLKKIKVCDTTTFFDKNGDGVIWYAKTANGVEFFNAHGRHPENNRPLRPVTHYILSKYAKK
jgi:hypothetical protein